MAFTHDNRKVIAATAAIIVGFFATRLISADPIVAAIYTACLCSGMIPLAWLERRRPQAFDPFIDMGSAAFVSAALPFTMQGLGLSQIEIAGYGVVISLGLQLILCGKRLADSYQTKVSVAVVNSSSQT